MWPIIAAAVLLIGCLKREENNHPTPIRLAHADSPATPPNPNIHEEHRTTLQNAVNAQLARSEYVFIGEDHAVKDEVAFPPMMRSFYNSGARNFAVEIGTHEQAAMDTFIQTGNASQFTDHSQVMSWPEVQTLYRSAAQAGMRVVCIDQPNRTGYLQREQYLAEQLMRLRPTVQTEDKTIVWIGGLHAMNRQQPYPTARTLLQNGGYRTSAMILESQTTIDFERRFDLDITAMAFQTFFGTTAPTSSFSYPTQQIGLSFFVTTSIGAQGSRQNDRRSTSYRDSYDYVAFLSRTDGGDAGSTNRY